MQESMRPRRCVAGTRNGRRCLTRYELTNSEKRTRTLGDSVPGSGGAGNTAMAAARAGDGSLHQRIGPSFERHEQVRRNRTPSSKTEPRTPAKFAKGNSG